MCLTIGRVNGDSHTLSLRGMRNAEEDMLMTPLVCYFISKQASGSQMEDVEDDLDE